MKIFSQLEVLYLHNNQISDWNTITQLAGCTKLSLVTFYDNPVSHQEGYRHFVVNMVSCIFFDSPFILIVFSQSYLD